MPARSDQAPLLFPNLGFAVLLSFGLLVIQIAGGGLIGLYSVVQGDQLSDALNPWTLAVANTVAAGMILILAFRRTREKPRTFFALGSVDRRLLPAVVVSAAGLAVILTMTTNLIMAVLRLLPGFEPEDIFKWRDFPIGTAFVTVIVAPVTEEYLFRGMILRGLLAHYRPAKAIWITAILFGMVHANPPQFLLGVVLGTALGWWYVQTRSLVPCIVGHAVFNIVGASPLVFPELSAIGFNYPTEPIVHQPPWLILGGFAVAGLGLWWFRRLTGPLPGPAYAEPPLLAEPPPLLPATAPTESTTTAH